MKTTHICEKHNKCTDCTHWDICGKRSACYPVPVRKCSSFSKKEENVDHSCDCEKWKYNIPKMNGVVHLAYVHGADVAGDKFDFCPWCGKSLKNDD